MPPAVSADQISMEREPTMPKLVTVVFVVLCFSGCSCEAEWQPGPVYSEAESVEYMQGGWSAYDKTIIRCRGGEVVVLTGHHSVKKGDRFCVWDRERGLNNTAGTRIEILGQKETP